MFLPGSVRYVITLLHICICVLVVVALLLPKASQSELPKGCFASIPKGFVLFVHYCAVWCARVVVVTVVVTSVFLFRVGKPCTIVNRSIVCFVLGRSNADVRRTIASAPLYGGCTKLTVCYFVALLPNAAAAALVIMAFLRLLQLLKLPVCCVCIYVVECVQLSTHLFLVCLS